MVSFLGEMLTTYPLKNMAHWTQVIEATAVNRGLAWARASRRGTKFLRK